jgi:nucleoside-diphosphate-sugar epimerase
LSENILFDRAGDVEPVVLRLSTVFGLSPRMRFDLVVNTLTVRAVADGGITIIGGNQWRPNVHCRDAARAFIAALEALAERVAGEIFNVGGDSLNHTIAQLGDMVAETVGDVQIARQRDGTDLRDYRVSLAKIRRVLGFEPEWTVAAGIREVAAAVRAQPALRNYQNPAFHNVQALRQTLTTPRRRHGDWTAAREPTPAPATPA